MHTKLLQLCLTLCDPMDYSPDSSIHGDSPGKNTGVGCHALLQEIFLPWDQTHDSCTGRQVLFFFFFVGRFFTTSTTWEAEVSGTQS